MRALEFIRDHVTFKLPFDFSYQMKFENPHGNLNFMFTDLQCPGDGTCSYQGLCDVSTGTCVCNSGFQGDMCQGNVCFIKIRSKNSSNTLMSLLRIFMKQTLIVGPCVYVSIVLAYLCACRAK